MRWQTLDENSPGRLREQIKRAGGNRCYWKIDLVNKIETPDLSMEIVDLLPVREQQRASYIRVRCPMNVQAEFLKELSFRVFEALPWCFGTAGYLFNYTLGKKDISFDQIWAWARRFWGVEVNDTESASWDALNGVLNVNWLTFLGQELLNEKLPTLNWGGPFTQRIKVFQLAHGLAAQAGPQPIIGDLNLMEDLSAYKNVARLLEPALATECSSFQGMFSDHGSTMAWRRRYLEPRKWLEPELI
jgi:hypothetical protein